MSGGGWLGRLGQLVLLFNFCIVIKAKTYMSPGEAISVMTTPATSTDTSAGTAEAVVLYIVCVWWWYVWSAGGSG